jgi:hypothetical protein
MSVRRHPGPSSDALKVVWEISPPSGGAVAHTLNSHLSSVDRRHTPYVNKNLISLKSKHRTGCPVYPRWHSQIQRIVLGFTRSHMMDLMPSNPIPAHGRTLGDGKYQSKMCPFAYSSAVLPSWLPASCRMVFIHSQMIQSLNLLA